MKTTYNFILYDLLGNSEDKEFIDGFVTELVNKGIILEVEFHNEQFPTNEPYAKLKSLIDQTMETIHLKIKCVKDQDFEGAASFRSQERKILFQIEKTGFELYKLQQDEFALYHVDVNKKGLKIKFIAYTNSEKFIAFIENIKERESINKSNKL